MKFGYTTKKDRKAKLKVKKKIVEAIGWLVIQDVHFKHKLNVKLLKRSNQVDQDRSLLYIKSVENRLSRSK